MDKKCDLHTHSIFSDGTFTPSQIIDEALSLGLGAVALTDHNTIAGLDEFLSYAKGKDITAVPGIEFSTNYRGKELHILGLFVSPEHYGEINDLVGRANERKNESNIALIKALNEDGYELDYEAIKSSTPNGQVNRAHIAAAMLEKGYVKSIKEAFSTLLSSKGKYYRPPERLSSLETISFIKSIGALPILAHPFLNMDENMLREFILEAKPYGLAGMETIYSTYTEEISCLAEKIAEEYSLIRSGGSDFHAQNKPDISLGSGKGNLSVPMSVFERMREYVED